MSVTDSSLSVRQILMDNRAHSGKVKITLQNQASITECKDPNVSGHGQELGVQGEELGVRGVQGEELGVLGFRGRSWGNDLINESII